MKARLLMIAVVAVFAVPSLATAQDRVVVNSIAGLQDQVAGWLTATAENVPEDLYSYRPTEEVRTLGGILAHVANAQFAFCAAVAGESNPAGENFEQTRTTKEGIQEALASGFEYCSGVMEGLNDTNGAEVISLFGNEMAKTGVMAFNMGHNFEHYGNLVTYMRSNGIVPPSSGGM